MRQWFTLGVLGLVMVACGGTSSLGKSDDKSKEDPNGDAGVSTGGKTGTDPETGGDPNVGSGGKIEPGTGGQTSTGGVTGGQCKADTECAAPAVCKQCPDGKFSCAQASCTNGECTTTFPECNPTNECAADADCPSAPPGCVHCADGSDVCARVECQKGQCIGIPAACDSPLYCDPALCPQPANAKACCLSPNGPCGADEGKGCVSTQAQCAADRDCPIPPIPCKPCPGGSCQLANERCVAGMCTLEWESCGGQKPTWQATCGDPVCKIPPADGTGGVNGGPTPAPLPITPPCDPKQGQVEGQACPTDGQACDPGTGCGQLLICTTTDPTNGGQCPISKAEYKKDIEYVGKQERAKLAEDLQSIPLVRYRYKQGPNREFLGFIIDDIEPSPSIDSEHGRVDLYGYTSMAVAALQEQHAQIEELRREVKTLKSQLAHKNAR